MRYLIVFGYDGSNYFGFQKQGSKKTIQKTIENVLFKMNKEKVVLVGSGRTDTGVHAIGATAHFDLNIDIGEEKLKKAMNSLLPNDIYIKKTKKMSSKFHARFDVVKKEYQYLINIEEYNLFERNYVYQLNQELDLEKIKKAIKFFEGENDFSSFCKKNKKEQDYIRTIYKTKIIKRKNIIYISFLGSGFLRYMVRNMVGSLIEVGLNKRKAESIKELIDNKDRKKAGIKAPAEGLYLKKVYYS